MITQQEWTESIYKNVNELAQLAWTLGIDIVSIKLKDLPVREGTDHGDEIYTVKAPKLKEINTGYMTIKVIKEESK